MARFKKLTSTAHQDKTNAVIMGRKTFESIPQKFRPLRDRLNIVLTTQPQASLGSVQVCDSFEGALKLLERDDLRDKVENVFVIGGSRVFDEALRHPRCESIYLTRILHPSFECDVFFPEIPQTFFLDVDSEKAAEHEEEGVRYKFLKYIRKGEASGEHEEQQYLKLVKDIIENGNMKEDRTGTGTFSKFGAQMRFNLRNGVFPLLTTKYVWFKGVAEELLWFISGTTNAKKLSEKKVRIWEPNGTKEFLTKRGLGHREEGDLGPVYGFQWRHFGAKYVDMHTDYTGQGVDQLAACIEMIKKDPDSRRIVMTAWNPADLNEMALPPCHMFCQFYVAKGELSCHLYQRSADMGLGVPFNIASYALLTRLVAQVCDLHAGDLVHSLGDAHVYKNHVEGLLQQIERDPLPFPILEIDPSIKDIDSFSFEHLKVVGYKHHPKIDLPFAV